MKKKILTIFLCMLMTISVFGGINIAQADHGDPIAEYTTPYYNPYDLTWDGNNFWCTDMFANKIHKLSIQGTELTISKTIDLPSGRVPTGITWADGYIWYIDSQYGNPNKDIIYKIDTNGNEITNIDSPGFWAEGLSYDGFYLYLTDSGFNKVYKINPNNGENSVIISSPNDWPTGFECESGTYWLADSQKIYHYSHDKNLVSSDTFNTPDNIAYGIAFDGEYLWCVGGINDKIYKIEVTTEYGKGVIVEGQSNYERGPIITGEPISPACYLWIKNVGIGKGSIYVKFYEYPGMYCEKVLNSHEWTDMNADDYDGINFHATAPNQAGSYSLGVKVWGNAESEPSWGTPEKTYTWDVIIEETPKLALGMIVKDDSDFKTGPYFTSYTVKPICDVKIKNIGDKAGQININFYKYPGTSNECLIGYDSWPNLGPNQERTRSFDETTPNQPGTFYLGVKVWGEDEAEPEWGTPEKTHIWGVEVIVNNPPSIPELKVEDSYDNHRQVSCISYDNDFGDQVTYIFNWTIMWIIDGNYIEYGPYEPNQKIYSTWELNVPGFSELRVKARDLSGAESDWSPPLQFKNPKNKFLNFPLINTILQRIIQRFHILEQIIK